MQHLPNPAEGRNYQMEALADARRHAIVRGADWLWVADVDEFLNIHAGNGTLADLIRACHAPQAISVHFQFFANCGVGAFRDEPVIAQFTRSHNPDLFGTQFVQEVKTLMKPGLPIKYIGAHRPFLREGALEYPQPVWTDASGRPVPKAFYHADNKHRLRKFPAKGARVHATLNHYALRSLDSYLVKNDRGDVNRENRAFDTTYWRERNDDAFEDLSIQRHLPALRESLDALKADPEIAALHADCVAAHKASCKRLMKQPGTKALREALTKTPILSEEELRVAELVGQP